MVRRKLDLTETSQQSESTDSEFDASTYTSSNGDSSDGVGSKRKQISKKKSRKKRKKTSKKKSRKKRPTSRKDSSPSRTLSSERYFKNPSLERKQASPPRQRKKKDKTLHGRSKTPNIEEDILPGTYKPASPTGNSNKASKSAAISDMIKRNNEINRAIKGEKVRTYSIEMNTANSETTSVLLKGLRKPPPVRHRPQHGHPGETVVAASRPPQGYQARQIPSQTRKRTALAPRKGSEKSYKTKLSTDQIKNLQRLQLEHRQREKRRQDFYRKKAMANKEKNLPMPSPSYEPLYDILETLRKKCYNQLCSSVQKIYDDCVNFGEDGKGEEKVEEFRIKSLSCLVSSHLAESAAWLKAHKGVRSLAILYALIDFTQENKEVGEFILGKEALLMPMAKLIARVLKCLDDGVMRMVLAYMHSRRSPLTTALVENINNCILETSSNVLMENLPLLYIINKEKESLPHPLLGKRRNVETVEPMLYDDERKYDTIVINNSPSTQPVHNANAVASQQSRFRKSQVDKRRPQSEESASSDEGPEYFPPPQFARHMSGSSGSLSESAPSNPPPTKASSSHKKTPSSDLDSKGIYRSPCGKTFTTYRGYKQHSRKNFECQVCVEALKEGKIPTFEALCGIDFDDPVDLRNHNKGDVRCSECARIFEVTHKTSQK